MLSLINPTALPALRIAGTFFLITNLLEGAYIFRNRRRFFGKDPTVSNDIPAVRNVRFEVVLIPSLFLTRLITTMSQKTWSYFARKRGSRLILGSGGAVPLLDE